MALFETKKSLGQHFLSSDVVPKWMCDAASVAQGDIVLEIGPGTGVLTKELLLRGSRVIAIEADLRAIEVLRVTFRVEIANGALTIYHIDARTLDLQNIEGITDGKFKVVANIPYYLSGLLFRTFLQSPVQPSALVFLVQKEVAKRITSDIARGEKESILSLSVKAYGMPRYVKTVTKGHFTPSPKIDSAVISIEHIQRTNFTDLPESYFFDLLHIGFGQKRKQLLGNLSKYYDRTALTNTFSTLEIPLLARAEDLPLQIWLRLALSLFALPHTQDLHT